VDALRRIGLVGPRARPQPARPSRVRRTVMTAASLKYTWLTYRRDQLWFPLAFLAFFIVAVVVMRHPAIRFSLARAYLGFFLPLIGGILAAYAVLDDPALEL